MRIGRRVVLALLLLGVPSAAVAAPPDGASADASAARLRYARRPDALFPYGHTTIYKDFFAEIPQFRGAGRDRPEPAVDTVKVGFIGPLLAADGPRLAPGTLPVAGVPAKVVFGRHLLQGATLALEQANAAGGYKGKPFELVRRTDLVQWGQTSNELAQFAYDDRVWAILGSVDSNHNHVLSRATLKAEVPIVNAGTTDPTLTEHSIPWLVRSVSDDRAHTYELLSEIVQARRLTRIALLRVNDRDGRMGVRELVRGLRRLGHPVLIEQRFLNGDRDFAEPLARIQELGAEAIVLWANPAEGAAIMKQMRERGMTQSVFGFDRLSHPLFLGDAGKAAEGVVVASSYNPDRTEPRWLRFREAYRSRFGEEPDAYAVHGYDGMDIIVAAIRQAGLNRVLIRDALFALRHVNGAGGDIDFDATLNDVARPWLAVVEQGRLRYFHPPDWKRAQLPRVVLSAR